MIIIFWFILNYSLFLITNEFFFFFFCLGSGFIFQEIVFFPSTLCFCFVWLVCLV
ncbi:hypothetical protein DFH28DRAFT_953638 [Melampsora americana]|nr:hypothetical protein DFH28DRAFT_953638 [Melampsora americana]